MKTAKGVCGVFVFEGNTYLPTANDTLPLCGQQALFRNDVNPSAGLIYGTSSSCL